MSLKTHDAAVRVEFAGASLSPTLSLAGDTVVYRDPWPGIEVQYAPCQQTLKSEYRVAAGADPNLIRLRYESSGAVRILGDGLVVGLPIRWSSPGVKQRSFQRVRDEGGFRVEGHEFPERIVVYRRFGRQPMGGAFVVVWAGRRHTGHPSKQFGSHYPPSRAILPVPKRMLIEPSCAE